MNGPISKQALYHLADMTEQVTKSISENISPFFMIAGGFYRDIIYNIYPKDIDIFIAHEARSPKTFERKVHKAFKQLHEDFEVSTIPTEYLPTNSKIKRHFKGILNKGYLIKSVDIMFVDGRAFYKYPVRYFPAEISKVWWENITGKLLCTKGFCWDYKTNSISTISPSDKMYTPRTKQYIDKLITKFPGKVIRHPEETAFQFNFSNHLNEYKEVIQLNGGNKESISV